MAKKRYIDSISLQALQHLNLLAHNIREAREARGLSIEQMAERCFMSKNTYQAVENGRLETGMGAYLSVLDYFGLSDSVADVAAPHKDEEGRRLRMMKRQPRSSG